MGWYQKGSTAESRERARKEARSNRKIGRFFLKGKETRRIIMLDDQEFCIWEHHLKINGQWGNFFTCRKGADQNDPSCPLCTSKASRSYTGFITVLDETGWKNSKGEMIKYGRQLFPMSIQILERFATVRDRKTSLVGTVWELTRSSDSAPRLGDVWDYIETVDPFEDEKYWFTSRMEGKKKPPEVFDYKEIFMPLSCQEMRALGLGSSKGMDDSDKEPDNFEGGDDDALY